MTDATSGTQPEALRPPIIAVEHVFKSVTDATGTLDILRDIDFSLPEAPTMATVRLAGHDMFALDEDARA
ncbi:MAG TPA: ABC transporter, partial [Ottowia sp.]|nr:ABC transporter [Ottowia sp.]